jgi:SPP1 gp7 family putative phage head morphogenesis protein
MPDTEVLLYVRNRENLMKGIPGDIHRNIMDTLEQGIQNGESTAKLAGRVKAAFNGIEASRALTIAQTETASAYGYARQRSMKEAGIEYKQWLTSGNANVRPSHAAANGQTVKIDEDFNVGDSLLKYPSDPQGDAEETISCHCIEIAVKAPKED